MRRKPPQIHRPCRDQLLRAPSRPPPPRARRAHRARSGHRIQLCACGDRSTPRGSGGFRRLCPPRPLPLPQQSVLADEQVEMGAFLLRELEEHLLPFGFLKALAVPLEEFVRATLALDPDEQ